MFDSVYKMEYQWVLIFYSTHIIALNALDNIDPCTTAYILDRMHHRKKEIVFSDTSQMLCDRYRLGSGRWVRADGQDLLQTEPGPTELCGTRYPIWMNESLPKIVGEEVEREACVVGLNGPCSKRLQIKIKKCQGYNVYYLTPPDGCYKAYCFQITEGNTTDEVVSQPVMRYELVRIENPLPHQELQFICEFPFKESQYYYQVIWYIQDKSVVITNAVNRNAIKQTNLRYGQGYTKLGINIKCAVRLKLTPEGAPGPLSKHSLIFFAGIQVTSTVMNIRRDEPWGNITIKLTVPFGCRFFEQDILDNCGLDVDMNVPRDPTKCSPEIAATMNDRGRNCGLRIFNKDLNLMANLSIALFDILEYDFPDGALRIGMITGPNNENPAWSGIELQDVYLYIQDTPDVWQGKGCAAFNDPHMRTFDGMGYENQNKGWFTLYQRKNKDFPTEVQIETTKCNSQAGLWFQPYCVCAVAVRAGADVFLIDRCPSRRTQISYLTCKENLLDARIESENIYKIYFPSGTYVHAVLGNMETVFTINVYVVPSKSDTNKTLGLCGTLNGITTDDFMDRDGNVLRENQFIEHWRLQEKEFLANMDDDELDALPSWKNDVSYCTCPHSDVQGNEPLSTVTCSKGSIVTCAKDNKEISKYKCGIRSKRSVQKPFSHKMFQINKLHFNENKEFFSSRTKRETNENWTEEKARSYCNDFMKNSQTFKACSHVPSVNSGFLIENCVLDILMTNSTVWAPGSREALRTACMKELSQNTTLKKQTENGKPSVAEQIKMITCINECSGRGICINGTCDCEQEYGAKDCSANLNRPPFVYGVNLDDGGLCDKRHCQRALVEGFGFLDMKSLKCLLKVFQVHENKTLLGEDGEYVVPGVHDSIAEVFCPLWPARRRRSIFQGFVQGITMSVSNNGQNYSTEHTLYILDGDCQDTVNVSGDIQFTLKKGYCYINGQCYVNGQINDNENCSNCNSSKSSREWSNVDGCGVPLKDVNKEQIELRQKRDSSPTIIIVTVIGCLLFVGVIVLAVHLYKKRKNSKRYSFKLENEVSEDKVFSTKCNF